MKENIEQLIKKDAEAVRLSDAEKSRLRNGVFSYVNSNPITSNTSKKSIKSPFSTWFFTRQAVGAYLIVLMVMGMGMGVSQAAAEALPGEPLYYVKVKVNEPVARSFAISKKSKAKAHADIAEERLSEMEKISNKPNVSQELTDELNSSFKEHSEKTLDYIEEIRKDGDLASATILASEFKTTLDAHTEILEDIDNDGPPAIADNSEINIIAVSGTSTLSSTDISSTSPQVPTSASSTISSLLNELSTQTDKLVTLDETMESEIASSTDSKKLKQIANKTLKKSDKRLEELHKLIDQIKNTDTEDELQEEIQTLEQAQNLILTAKEHLKNNEFKEAINLGDQINEVMNKVHTITEVNSELLEEEIQIDQSI